MWFGENKKSRGLCGQLTLQHVAQADYFRLLGGR
jgi:hypothetical protein